MMGNRRYRAMCNRAGWRATHITSSRHSVIPRILSGVPHPHSLTYQLELIKACYPGICVFAVVMPMVDNNPTPFLSVCNAEIINDVVFTDSQLITSPSDQLIHTKVNHLLSFLRRT